MNLILHLSQGVSDETGEKWRGTVLLLYKFTHNCVCVCVCVCVLSVGYSVHARFRKSPFLAGLRNQYCRDKSEICATVIL